MLTPATPEALAETLAYAASRKQTINLCGKSSKRKMAGPIEAADLTVSTERLTQILQYEPQDLTVSVEAGISYCALSSVLAQNRQMVPLDPPFADNATIGGLLASNSCGPRRRLYGSARDLVIGMKFATLEGKLVQSGGMVVKNVAGLDMGKLMIGSCGTLAAIAVVNFKVVPMPAVERTFLLAFDTVDDAIAARDRILASPLQPAALDLVNPAAAAEFSQGRFVLAVQAGGNPAALERYRFELSALADWKSVEGDDETAFWTYVREYTPRFLATSGDGGVVRVSCTLKELGRVMESMPGPAIARAGSGVVYGYFAPVKTAGGWISEAVKKGWKPVVEFAPDLLKLTLDLWPSPGGDLELMKRVKQMFDPHLLLNRGRLYGRI